MTALAILKKYFGFEEFRAEQEAIINTVAKEKRDCLVLMPTGGGKSVCYQIPAMMMEGVTIVISPLIALMKDQVDALRLNGVPAAFVNSSQSAREQQDILERLRAGELKLLYLAPERLSGSLVDFISILKSLKVSLFAIDEAHCISHWGHDFRPDYMLLARLKENFPDVPVIALTATADKLTRVDIVSKLLLKDPKIFVSSFNRANIRYTVDHKSDFYEKTVDFLKAHPKDTGIIYCLSRQNTEDLAERLVKDGFSAAAYHAGLDAKTRTDRQEQFKRDEVQIIVATIAFGMGIDKSNVRFVIHANMPKNIEGYYQETGRAGRDGLPSEAILFFSIHDVFKLKKFAQVESNPEQTRIMLKKLDQMADYSQALTCRRKYLLNYFDEKFEAPCGNCDVCLEKDKIELFDGTIIAQKALSAIVRLKEQFGVNYVINFLKGSTSEKIHYRHRDLPTFGKGKEFSADEWRFYMRQLMDQHLMQAQGDFSVLAITEKGRDVLFNNEKVLLQQFVSKKIERKTRKEKYAKEEKSLAYDTSLFEELRALRMNIARNENVPPYVIFPDSTLAELATWFPMELKDLPHIGGFGQVKIEKYGQAFLNAITSYCKRNSIASRIHEKHPSTKKKAIKKVSGPVVISPTQKETFDLYIKGLSPTQIAAQRKINEGTVMDHLLHFISTGDLNVLKFVPKEKLNRITAAIGQHGGARLSILKEDLGEGYSYTEIKATIQYLKRKTS